MPIRKMKEGKIRQAPVSASPKQDGFGKRARGKGRAAKVRGEAAGKADATESPEQAAGKFYHQEIMRRTRQIKADPENLMAYYSRGKAKYESKEDRIGALEDFAKATADPAAAKALVEYMQARGKKGKGGAAAEAAGRE